MISAPREAGFWSFLALKLSRVTSSGAFVPEIDGLRCIAILAVVILHATYQGLRVSQHGQPLPASWPTNSGSVLIQLFSGGWVGVQIFFVISGFILALPFARQHIKRGQRVSIPRYFSRRLTRIEPPYFICLTFAWLIVPFADRMALLPHYSAGLFYAHQIVFHKPNPVLTPSWSLEVEVFFYCLAPWLCGIFALRQPGVRRSVLAVTTLGYSYWAANWVIPARGVLDNTLVADLQFFLAGMLLADLYVGGAFGKENGLKRRLVWDVAALSASVGLIYAVAWGGWQFFWLAPLFIMLLVIGAFEGALFNRVMRMKAVTVIGGMCYSIYLWHTVGMWFTEDYLVKKIPHNWTPLGAVLATLSFDIALSITLGAVTFYFIEKPFMNGPGSRFLERLFQRVRSVGMVTRRQIVT